MKYNKVRVTLLTIILVLAIVSIIGWSRSGTETKNYAAIPSAALGPEISDKGYFVEEINDGIYWVTDGVYQAMFVVTENEVIVVDAPPSIGENILKAIAEVTYQEITHVIYSHSHADHIAAASIYPKNATYIAHRDTITNLKNSNPNYEFGAFLGGSEAYTLTIGNYTLELNYKSINHNAGNIFIYAPEQKVLMVVDVIFPGWSPFKDLAIATDVTGFVKAHDDILSYDFDTLISGHVGRLGTREDVETQKKYVLDMQANAAKALQTVDFNTIAAEVGSENLWLLFDTYLNEVSQECTDLTLAKWNGKLAAADVFTPSHCSKLAESLRVD
jgi:glyoxylase-like metal-dependent hydrolase (beta-lactamase superfamily II)